MNSLFRSLVTLLATVIDHQLTRYVEFLEAENALVRARLPVEIRTRPAERERLLALGVPRGRAIESLITLVTLVTLVTPAAFYRWQREASRGKSPRPRPHGESRVLRELVVKIARDTGFGTARIFGELRRLGIGRIGRQTVKNILVEAGIEPSPKRARGTWDEFLRSHPKTLWACDFFTKRALTARGFVELDVLVFVHLQTREVFCSSATKHPTSAWVTEQPRAFVKRTSVRETRPTPLIHDRDTKFSAECRAALGEAGIQCQELPVRSPNLNAPVERFIQALEHEMLDRFVVLGRDHLDHLVSTFVAHDSRERPPSRRHHRNTCDQAAVAEWTAIRLDQVECRRQLGGVIRSMHRHAA